jgi:alpha-acetolactate decarboxylase
MPGQLQHTLYQVSTATALVEGLYEGAVASRHSAGAR